MLTRRESGSRTVQKFASQRGKQEVTEKGKSTAEVASCMAIIRLMLPLFCQLISISPRVLGENRSPSPPPRSTETHSPGARHEVRHGERWPRTGPRRVCEEGRASGEPSPTAPPTPSAPGTLPARREKISQHPGGVSVITSPSPRSPPEWPYEVAQPAQTKVMANTRLCPATNPVPVPIACPGTGCRAETGGREQAIVVPHFERG